MIEILSRTKNIPIPDRAGLVSALRSLDFHESFVVPAGKKNSIHPAAKRAGVRVTVRTLGDGTVRVWRVSPITKNAGDIVGIAAADPVTAAATKPASIFDEPAAPATLPAASKPVRSGPGYFQATKYGARIYTEDLSTAPANSIFE